MEKNNNKAGFFIVIFKHKILTCFIPFTKMCKISLKLAYDVDFGCLMKALLFSCDFSMHIIYSMKWTVTWSISKVQLYAFNLCTTFHLYVGFKLLMHVLLCC